MRLQDFQSLYPSMIIAYNLCYSTCIGRPAHARAHATPLRLGATQYSLPDGSFAAAGAAAAAAAAGTGAADASAGAAAPEGGAGAGSSGATGQAHGSQLRSNSENNGGSSSGSAGLDPESLIIAPNGVAYVPPSVRPGVLPRMLHEILSTRIMVKGAMKRVPPSNKVGVLGVAATAVLKPKAKHGFACGLLPFSPLAQGLALHPSLHVTKYSHANSHTRTGAAARPECAPVWPQDDCQRLIWLHQRIFQRPYALC